MFELHAIAVIAARESRDAWRNRWFLLFTAAVNATAVTTENTRALAAEGKVATDLATEKKRAEDSEVILTNAVAAESAARVGAVSGLDTRLTSELNARVAADEIHSTDIATNATNIATNVTAISDELSRATGAESTLQANINSLGTTVFNLQESTSSALSDEVSAINNSISSEAKTAADASSAEKTRAETAEAGLQSQISSLLSNTDAVALNSLAELVADYSTNGNTVTTSLNAALVRITQLEATIIALQASGFAAEEGEEEVID